MNGSIAARFDQRFQTVGNNQAGIVFQLPHTPLSVVEISSAYNQRFHAGELVYRWDGCQATIGYRQCRQPGQRFKTINIGQWIIVQLHAKLAFAHTTAYAENHQLGECAQRRDCCQLAIGHRQHRQRYQPFELSKIQAWVVFELAPNKSEVK